jgi:hypothetical protein
VSLKELQTAGLLLPDRSIAACSRRAASQSIDRPERPHCMRPFIRCSRCFQSSVLNDFMAMGHTAWSAARGRLQAGRRCTTTLCRMHAFLSAHQQRDMRSVAVLCQLPEYT